MMHGEEPQGVLDPRFSSPEAQAAPWASAERGLAEAELYWISTVRADGRPHTAPLIGVWLDGALHFCSGSEEQKTRNLESNPRCTLTTGRNTLNDEGMDLVVEGEARRVRDGARLQRIAEAYLAKYGEAWRFTVEGEGFRGSPGNTGQVYAVAPAAVFGFGKGAVFSQTRWRPAPADEVTR